MVVLTPWFPNKPNDSRFTYIYDSAAALARQGVKVHVLVCRPFAPSVIRHFAPQRVPGTIDKGAFPSSRASQRRHYPNLPRGWLRTFNELSYDQSHLACP